MYLISFLIWIKVIAGDLGSNARTKWQLGL
jgi:hypothetical protein